MSNICHATITKTTELILDEILEAYWMIGIKSYCVNGPNNTFLNFLNLLRGQTFFPVILSSVTTTQPYSYSVVRF